MKYCGCESCRRNGEINPLQQFETYLANKDEEFEKIFLNSYTVGEMDELYKLEPGFKKNSVVNRINQHVPFDAHAYWLGMSIE